MESDSEKIRRLEKTVAFLGEALEAILGLLVADGMSGAGSAAIEFEEGKEAL